jgi:hypothetical protein
MTEPTTAELEAQRALAAQLFPSEWARALTITGKRGGKMRAGLRHRAVAKVKIDELRATGASCANCSNRTSTPWPKDQARRWACDLGSDFHGYQITQLDAICPDWSAK